MSLKLIALLAGAALLAGCGRTPEPSRLTVLEDRVSGLELAQLVERPFMGAVSREEGNAVGQFADAVIGTQKSGFLLTGIRFGANSIAIDFTRGKETLTKTVHLYSRLP